MGLAINLPPDRSHTKANTELEEKKKRMISWRYIKYCTRKTVYEKVFFQSSYLLKEVKSIHLTNLHSVYEYVARSTTPAAKQKLN